MGGYSPWSMSWSRSIGIRPAFPSSASEKGRSVTLPKNVGCPLSLVEQGAVRILRQEPAGVRMSELADIRVLL